MGGGCSKQQDDVLGSTCGGLVGQQLISIIFNLWTFQRCARVIECGGQESLFENYISVNTIQND